MPGFFSFAAIHGDADSSAPGHRGSHFGDGTVLAPPACPANRSGAETEHDMASKIQGEGDHESARHYNDETKRFVDEKRREGKDSKARPPKLPTSSASAEQQALSRAKSGAQDKRDAELLRDIEREG